MSFAPPLTRVLLSCVVAVVTSAANAATITVTTTADTVAPNDGSVSLREAITAINAGNGLGDPDIAAQSPGAFGVNDTIRFNIAGAGVHTIALTGSIPPIAKSVVIDGYSQPGSVPNTQFIGNNAVLRIRIDMGAINPGIVLQPASGPSTISGLALVNTPDTAIRLLSSGNRISGNYIGVEPNGTVANGAGTAVTIAAGTNSNSIGDGGSGSDASNNVMTSTGSDVVVTLGAAVLVFGNSINTNAAGTATLGSAVNAINVGGGDAVIFLNLIGPSSASGIHVAQQDALVPITSVDIHSTDFRGNLGGAPNGGLNGITLGSGTYAARIGSGYINGLGDGNTISGARGNGIALASGYTGTVNIIGNRISGSGHSGICIQGGGGGRIGEGILGDVFYFGNDIVGNATNGITIGGARAYTIQGNNIHDNGGVGISLASQCDVAASPTPNDTGDADMGANDLQNYPVLEPPIVSLNVIVSGSLNSTPLSTFLLDFYSANACKPLQPNDRWYYIGSRSVTTDASGNASFHELLFPQLVPHNAVIATATNAAGSTSEFSVCQSWPPPAPPLVPVPTLHAWVLVMLSALLSAGAFAVLQRRPRHHLP